MPVRDLLLTDVKFVFRAKIMRRRARKPTSSAYMATAHVEVGVVGRSETHVAYSVEPGRGRPAFEILTHGGRLYWPVLRGDVPGLPKLGCAGCCLGGGISTMRTHRTHPTWSRHR